MKLSLQQIFDIGVAGIRSQNYEKCVSIDGGCLYNHPNGVTHCAIGWVLKHAGFDQETIYELEGVPADELPMFDELDFETKQSDATIVINRVIL